MPDTIEYDEGNQRLLIGNGYIEHVEPEVWNYEISGKQVLRQWFSYRKANRERPIIGDRRPPSKLGDIQPDHWIAEYTTELLNLLNVIGRLVELEPSQSEVLEQICAGQVITADELRTSGALNEVVAPPTSTKTRNSPDQPGLLD